MITFETLIPLNKDYNVFFRVFDDTDSIVTIDNKTEEYGASSGDCKRNWNKGLAEAFVNIASMMPEESKKNLLKTLISDERIDNKFRNYLPFEDNPDYQYAGWCLSNNWLKLDDAAYMYVCGESIDDNEYKTWVEETLGIK